MFGPRYWGDGGDVAAVETYSGGWGHVRDETDSEREARIHADRIRLGILESQEAKKRSAKKGDGSSSLTADSFFASSPDPALALDLAQIHTGAYLDQEISRYFRLLEDEDDAAVLLLAIATLH